MGFETHSLAQTGPGREVIREPPERFRSNLWMLVGRFCGQEAQEIYDSLPRVILVCVIGASDQIGG